MSCWLAVESSGGDGFEVCGGWSRAAVARVVARAMEGVWWWAVGRRSGLGEGAAGRWWLVWVWQVCMHRVACSGLVRVVHPRDGVVQEVVVVLFAEGHRRVGAHPCQLCGTSMHHQPTNLPPSTGHCVGHCGHQPTARLVRQPYEYASVTLCAAEECGGSRICMWCYSGQHRHPEAPGSIRALEQTAGHRPRTLTVSRGGDGVGVVAFPRGVSGSRADSSGHCGHGGRGPLGQ